MAVRAFDTVDLLQPIIDAAFAYPIIEISVYISVTTKDTLKRRALRDLAQFKQVSKRQAPNLRTSWRKS